MFKIFLTEIVTYIFSTCRVLNCNDSSNSYQLNFSVSLRGRLQTISSGRINVIPECRCDSVCSQFGDCCVNAPTIKNSTLDNVTATCDAIQIKPKESISIYIKRSCTINKFSDKCLRSSNYTEQVTDSLLKFKAPVTNLETNVTYGNLFCARCNNVTNYRIWPMNVQCQTVSENLTIISNSSSSSRRSFIASRPDLKGRLKFNGTLKLWQMTVGNRTENCTLRPIPPDDKQMFLRYCMLNVISNCSLNGSATSAGQKCPAYMSIVYDRNLVAYRNEDCAKCNGVLKRNIRCSKPSISYPFPRPSRRTSLFFPRSPTVSTTKTMSNSQSNSSAVTTGTSTSKTTQTRSTTSKSRSTKRSSTSASLTRTTTPAPTKPADKRRAYMYLQIKMNCITALQSINFTKITAETVYSLSMNRSYIRNKTTIVGSAIEVCRVNNVTLNHIINPVAIHGVVEVIIILGFVVTVVLLLLHLGEFCSPKASKNLYEKALASYTIALLIGNIGLLLLLPESSQFCPVFSTCLYYGFLSSFFWLSSMAFDILCVIWTVAYKFQKPDKFSEDSRRFSVYSVLSWGVPAVITTLMIYLERNDSNAFFRTCFLQNDQMVLLFVTLPLTVCMSVNMSFYVCCAYVVCSESTVGCKLSSVHGIDFKLHTSLIMMTNLMWSTLFLLETNYFSWLLLAIFDFILGFVVYLCSPIENEVSKRASRFIKRLSFKGVDVEK